MTVLQSVFLGIVQGLTEFLPVSSSGHLAIMQNIFHIETDGGMLFDIMLHLGTLAAIFAVYYRDIWNMIKEAVFMLGDLWFNLKMLFLNLIHKTSLKYRRVVRNSYRKFVVLVLLSTIPTGIIGILDKDYVSKASETLLVPGICLLITAVLLLLADNMREGKKMPKDVSCKEGLLIGVAQGIATLPGLSRSGTTITACLFFGLDRRFAVKYSFILSIPAVLGAAVLELKELLETPTGTGAMAVQPGVYLTGMAVAGVVGYICIRTMLVLVRNKSFRYFSFYCFIAGILAIVGHFVL